MDEKEKSQLCMFIDYEVISSWWASWIWWDWGQEISGKYFLWKAKRKYAKYQQLKRLKAFVKKQE
jgi:hypothetical protein